jgi:hypothetical protein
MKGAGKGPMLKKTGKTGSAVVGMAPPQPHSCCADGHANKVQPAQVVTNYACGKSGGKK